MTIEQLRSEWSSRLSEGERAAIAAVGKRVGGRAIGEDAKAPDAAVRHAMEHWFERKSLVPERTLLAEAMRHAVGKASPESVEAAYQQQEFVFGEQDGRCMATTREVLKEEMRMIGYAEAAAERRLNSAASRTCSPATGSMKDSGGRCCMYWSRGIRLR